MKAIGKKILSALSAGVMLTSIVAPQCFAASNSGSGSVLISSVKDLMEFSENCSLDSWSAGKTVTLTTDINLDYKDFTPIPIFGGIFKGNGHSINGLRIEAVGSNIGLFRYVAEGGIIENLNVDGSVMPGGTQSKIGGIAGENYGTIRNCTFNGTVTGEEGVGGIAGSNTENGQIVSCSVSGTIRGKTSTGGIAGNNSGTIINCKNSAGINLTQSSTIPNPSDIDVDKIFESESEEDNILNSCSDTGGIVGYSDGIVQSCINNGDVGYPHIGYNTGGIAGRQSGYLSGCTNNGSIHGRKEVGGIVGQSEPYLSISPSSDLLDQLQTELDKLTNMIDGTLDNATDINNNASNHLTDIRNSAQQAKSSAQSISNDMDDFVNGNIESINMLTADISNAIDLAKPAADDFAELGSELSEIADNLSDIIEIMKDISDMSDKAVQNIEISIEHLNECAESIKDVSKDIGDALDQLQTSVIEDDAKALQDAAKALKRAIEAAGNILGSLSADTDSLNQSMEWLDKYKKEDSDTEKTTESTVSELEITGETAITENTAEAAESVTADLQTAPDENADNGQENSDLNNEGINASANMAQLSRIALIGKHKSADNTDKSDIDTLIDALNECAEALEKIADSLPEISEDLENAGDKLKIAADDAEKAAEKFGDALSSVSDAINDIKPAGDAIDAALDKLGAVTDHASYSGKLVEHAFGCISDSLDALSSINKTPFKPLSGNVRAESDNLFNTLSKMFDQGEALNTDLNNELNDLGEQFRDINRQINTITGLVIDEIRSLTGDSNDSWRDRIYDASEEDIAATREGKVADCRNNGTVEGDRNIGGIVGAMAIEYDLDPEDDITNNISVHARYETRSVLQSCVNYGEITAKKDGAGGLVGRMDLGTAINGENYGTIVGADYVGGAVGYADASVRNCYSKCRLSSPSYIGGIAGIANRLSGCFSIVTIVEGNEFMGAVAGNVKDGGTLKDNSFVNTGVAGVDGISYSQIAAPISFSRLSKIEGMPTGIRSFNIILNADGEEVKKIPFDYGQDLSKISLPDVPEKEGKYGVWPDFDKSGTQSDIVLEAQYSPIVTITQSVELNGKIALALVSGTFTDDTVLHAEEQDIEKPSAAGKNAKIYHLTLENADVGAEQEVPVRLLNPGDKKADVWIFADGKWSYLNGEQVGKYMLVSMTGTEATFCIATSDISWIPFVIGGAVVIIILVVLIVVNKTKKKGKNDNTSKNK